MNQYNDELYHYGVLGMKWGQRKYQSQQNTIKRLSDKRKDIASKKGVSSSSYMNTSHKLYRVKQKSNLTKSKIDNNGDNKILAKQKLKMAKIFKKNGVFLNGDGNDFRNVYGYNLSKKQKEAIATKEVNNYQKKEKASKIKRKTLAVASSIAPVAVTAGITYFNKNSGKIASKLAKNNIDVNKVNKFINKFNQVVYKAKYEYDL